MRPKIRLPFILLLLSCYLATLVWAQVPATSPAPAPAPAPAAAEPKPAAPAPVPATTVPDDPKKRTSLELYVTAKEAYEMWQKDPEKIKILDCRCPEEYALVGHAPMARNIPFKFITYKWDDKAKDYVWKENPKFLQLAKKYYKPTDTILVMCRSGHRSAGTIEKLAKAGYKNVYNIIDGFEGDKIRDKNDPNYGKRLKNGWKNSGLPWTYDLDPQLIYTTK